MANAFRKKLLIELLEEISTSGYILGERPRIVGIQPGDHIADQFFDWIGPNWQIPGKEIAFQEVCDVEMTKDAP